MATKTEMNFRSRDLLKNSDGKSNRQLAEAYSVGHTQVKKNPEKHEIMEVFQDNACSSRK